MSGSALMSATYFEMYQKPDESEEGSENVQTDSWSNKASGVMLTKASR